jgi:hypothetical protein
VRSRVSRGCAGGGNSYRRLKVENDDLTDATARNGGWTLDIKLLWFNHQNQRVKVRKSGLSVIEPWVKLVMGSCWWVEFEQLKYARFQLNINFRFLTGKWGGLPRRICGRCRELEPLWVLEALEEGKKFGRCCGFVVVWTWKIWKFGTWSSFSHACG